MAMRTTRKHTIIQTQVQIVRRGNALPVPTPSTTKMEHGAQVPPAPRLRPLIRPSIVYPSSPPMNRHCRAVAWKAPESVFRTSFQPRVPITFAILHYSTYVSNRSSHTPHYTKTQNLLSHLGKLAVM
jgi:hypothetical protein